jgi:HSP20 family molecular chaperone IbpA
MLKRLFGREDPLGIFFDDFWASSRWPRVLTGNMPEYADVIEEIENTKEGIKICIEVPGIPRGDILATVSDDGILKIKGKRSEELTNGYVSRIKKYGFAKEYDLEGLDKNSIEVVLKDGVLGISLKFKKSVPSETERKIEIKET